MSADLQCKNCGTQLAGQFCSACGQAADTRVPSLGTLLLDALGDLFNFDSRIWRSIRLLLFNPGRLTREYLEGRRARYVPPFRLYIVASLAFFFLLAALPDRGEQQTEAETPIPAPADADGERPRAGFNLTFNEFGRSGATCELGDPAGWNPEFRARLQEACERVAASDSGFGRALVENIPLMMFFFIPIVAAIMKLLYALARRKYVEHLLFCLHFHAFFFLLAIAGVLLSRLAGFVPLLDRPIGLISIFGWIYLPVYLFVAMRRVYGQGSLVTGLKYALLGGGYLVSLVVTFFGVLAYTAFTL